MMTYKTTKLLFSACLMALVPLFASAELKRPAISHTTKARAAPLPADGDTSLSSVPLVDRNGNVPNSPASQVALAFARLHHVNMMEIEAGALAMRRGASPEVRKYGERLMRDHQNDDRELMAFAESKNISMDRVPGSLADLSVNDAAMNVRLQEAAPEDFDRVFLQEMSKGHANTVSELTGSIDQMSDRAARRFLSKMRPIIVQHERLGNILLERNS
ncbi:MAG: DUF4142 domain-containing protein [Bdellovibrionota bacterium]